MLQTPNFIPILLRWSNLTAYFSWKKWVSQATPRGIFCIHSQLSVKGWKHWKVFEQKSRRCQECHIRTHTVHIFVIHIHIYVCIYVHEYIYIYKPCQKLIQPLTNDDCWDYFPKVGRHSWLITPLIRGLGRSTSRKGWPKIFGVLFTFKTLGVKKKHHLAWTYMWSATSFPADS